MYDSVPLNQTKTIPYGNNYYSHPECPWGEEDREKEFKLYTFNIILKDEVSWNVPLIPQ